MKTTSVTTLTQLNEALQDTTVQRIRLLNDIVGNLSLTRKVDLALNGFKVTGNVGINHSEAGTVTIEAGTIEGDLTVNTPNATVINKANVTGTVLIKDVAESTFDNSGYLAELRLEDTNGARIINRQAELVKVITIDTSASVNLEGEFDEVNVLKQAFLTFSPQSKIETISAADDVMVQVVKPEDVVINHVPVKFNPIVLSQNELAIQKDIRQLLREIELLLNEDLSKDDVVENIFEKFQSVNMLLMSLNSDEVEGTDESFEYKRLALAYWTMNNEFQKQLPTPQPLEDAMKTFVPTIQNAENETGAYIALPTASEGIYFYISSDDIQDSKYMIPARPDKNGEVRHVVITYTFQTNYKHLSKTIILHIPHGDEAITYEYAKEGQHFPQYDYITSSKFEFGMLNSYHIMFEEGSTVQELLDSPLFNSSEPKMKLTPFQYVGEDVLITEAYQAVFNSKFNSRMLIVEKTDAISEETVGYIPVEDGGVMIDLKNNRLFVKGDLLTSEVSKAIEEAYPTMYPNEVYGNLNFANLLAADEILKTDMQLAVIGDDNSLGMYLLRSKQDGER
ncbi:hypothetical protein [Exiguobacterium sp. s196]|uniref:hypothetical protein n=1 Tax=Exiguobacterium sp. s196 TaxID=2751283 RepID=UPI001BE7763A|nr:hypothetical protein [Exiguobacterium sp. s196]